VVADRNLHASSQDNRVSEACERLNHQICSGSYPALRAPAACHCACHTLREARSQLAKLLHDIDSLLGAEEPPKAQGEQGGEEKASSDSYPPVAAADDTSAADGSLCDSAGQRQASPSDRAEGSSLSSSDTATSSTAGARSPASRVIYFLFCGSCGLGVGTYSNADRNVRPTTCPDCGIVPEFEVASVTPSHLMSFCLPRRSHA